MNRVEALAQIVTFGPERDNAYLELVKYSYDSDVELFEVSESKLSGVLIMSISGNISDDELEDWANFVECRDDLDYERIEGYIYALANPLLIGGINRAKIEKMLGVLNASTNKT
jgi:hypothetical protein